jgi:hypothetical protein
MADELNIQADLTSNNTEGTKSTNHSNSSSAKGVIIEEEVEKPRKSKKDKSKVKTEVDEL